MRILLAVDGSVSSDRAAELVASVPLPEGSTIRVVTVQQSYSDVLAMSWAASVGEVATPETEVQVDARHHREAVERAEHALQRPDIKVEGFVLRSVHRFGVQLALRFRWFRHVRLQRLTHHTSARFRGRAPGPISGQLYENPPAGDAGN